MNCVLIAVHPVTNLGHTQLGRKEIILYTLNSHFVQYLAQYSTLTFNTQWLWFERNRNCIFQRYFGLQKDISMRRKLVESKKLQMNFHERRTISNDVSFVLIKMRWFKIYIGWEFYVNYSSFEKEKKRNTFNPVMVCQHAAQAYSVADWHKSTLGWW